MNPRVLSTILARRRPHARMDGPEGLVPAPSGRTLAVRAGSAPDPTGSLALLLQGGDRWGLLETCATRQPENQQQHPKPRAYRLLQGHALMGVGR
jgi:hypothetical protein